MGDAKTDEELVDAVLHAAADDEPIFALRQRVLTRFAQLRAVEVAATTMLDIEASALGECGEPDHYSELRDALNKVRPPNIEARRT